MPLGQIVLLVLALFMFVGAVMGFRAGSRPSLIAGTASGLALLLALWVAQSNPRAGLVAGVTIALVLSVMFARRLAATRKFMPAGLLLAISLIATALLGYSLAV